MIRWCLIIIASQLTTWQKLKLLSDMDEKILNLCKVDGIETEVNGSEAIVAEVINCKLKIEEPPPAVPQGLPLTERNYDSAIAMLKDRFGDPQQIISAHVDELMKITSCVSEGPGSLCVVFDKIMVHVRGLEELEVTSE